MTVGMSIFARTGRHTYWYHHDAPGWAPGQLTNLVMQATTSWSRARSALTFSSLQVEVSGGT